MTKVTEQQICAHEAEWCRLIDKLQRLWHSEEFALDLIVLRGASDIHGRASVWADLSIKRSISIAEDPIPELRSMCDRLRDALCKFDFALAERECTREFNTPAPLFRKTDAAERGAA